MIILGHCFVCGKPFTALHENAGAITPSCKHPPAMFVWLPTKQPLPQPDAEK